MTAIKKAAIKCRFFAAAKLDSLINNAGAAMNHFVTIR